MTLNETAVVIGQEMARVTIEGMKNGTPWWVILLAIIGAGALVMSIVDRLSQALIILLYPLALIKLGYDYWKERRKHDGN